MTPTVEQCDREEAVAFARDYLTWNGHKRSLVLQGKLESVPLVQAFARHRIAVLEAAQVDDMRLRIERLEEALREAAERECSSWCYPSGGEHTRACIGFRAVLGDDG